MVFPVGWGRKVALTIPAAQVSGTGTHTGFPVLITRANLPDEMCDPSGINAAQSDGGDLRASSDEAGTTQLPLEVVDFGHDSSTGAGDAAVELWVKRDLNTASDTVIYLWYNEATASQPAVTDAAGRNAVWSGYNFVSHLGSTTPVDSTGNNTITKVGAPALAAAGVGDGLDFQNTAAGTATDYLHAPVADPGNTFVLSAWVDIASAAVQQKPFILRTAANAAHYLDTGFGSQDVRAVINNDFNGIAATGSAFPTALSLLHMRWDGSTVYLYQDGAQVATKAYALTSDPIDQIIIAASNAAGEQAFDGILDEIRLASGDLDEHWIATEYANQGSPSTFITTGTPEAPASTTDASFAAASSGADSYVALVTLSASVSSAVSVDSSYAAVSQIVVTLTEAVSAQDSDAGPAQALASISAAASGNDLLDAIAQAAAAITAGAAAGESWVQDTLVPGESLVTLSESSEAGAAFVAAVLTIASITGAASVSDAAAATIAAIGSVSEGIAASDTNSVVGQILAAINESASAAAIYAAATSGDIRVSLSAGATASDSWVGTGPGGYLVAGAIAITAGLTATVSFSPAFDASIEINPN